MKVAPGDASFTCRECWTTCGLLWPPFAAAVERLLMMRPDVTTRNWEPGETLHDLLEENVGHGIGPAGPDQTLMIVGDEITKDSLPASPYRLKIGA